MLQKSSATKQKALVPQSNSTHRIAHPETVFPISGIVPSESFKILSLAFLDQDTGDVLWHSPREWMEQFLSCALVCFFALILFY
jgi:hypothetical protein